MTGPWRDIPGGQPSDHYTQERDEILSGQALIALAGLLAGFSRPRGETGARGSRAVHAPFLTDCWSIALIAFNAARVILEFNFRSSAA